MTQDEKPLFGVMPRKVWLEKRALELAEAIHGRLKHDIESLDQPSLKMWLDELIALREEWRALPKMGLWNQSSTA